MQQEHAIKNQAMSNDNDGREQQATSNKAFGDALLPADEHCYYYSVGHVYRAMLYTPYTVLVLIYYTSIDRMFVGHGYGSRAKAMTHTERKMADGSTIYRLTAATMATAALDNFTWIC